MKKIATLFLGIVAMFALATFSFAAEYEITSIKVEPYGCTSTIRMGETSEVKATITPSYSSETITWTISDTSVAIIEPEYNCFCAIRPQKIGKAYIKATTASGLEAGIYITVDYAEAKSIVLAGKTSLKIGESTQWKATVAPATANQWVSWTSGNPGVATVDAYGNIRAHKAGQANITATAVNGVKKTVLVTVNADLAECVTLAGKTSIKIGAVTQWKATVVPATANQWVSWTSGNPGVATVDAYGNIRAHKAGQANITATAANGVKKTVLITITADSAMRVSLSGKTSIIVGETVQWKATVAPATANQWVGWTSGNPGVATVDAYGNIRAIKAGQANITATAANGVKKTMLITVISNAPTSVTLSGKTSITVGETIKWKVGVSPAIANQWVWWSSGNPSVATVDQNGNIKAIKTGQANITATAVNGIKKTVCITVTEKVANQNKTTTATKTNTTATAKAETNTKTATNTGTSTTKTTKSASTGTASNTTTSGRRDCTRCTSGKCYRCFGRGEVYGDLSNTWLKCASCKGSGRCFMCDGKGYRD